VSDNPYDAADQQEPDVPLLIFVWTDDEQVETFTPDEDELETAEDFDFDNVDDDIDDIPF
jgi:hypothetical protein